MKNNKIDYDRYDAKFLNELRSSKEEISQYGANSYPAYLRAPYEFFEFKVKSIVRNNTKILDLCCGNGKHSITAAKCGGKVLGLDIVESSILIAKQKAKLNNVENNTNFLVSDINNLSLKDNSFDLVTCLGSLSYIDIDVFINEVKRVLKPGGKLIIVDSLDNNIIYKINRLFQVLTNRRTYSTFNRMPNSKTIMKIKNQFSNSEIKYFNSFVWIAPILKIFMKPNQIRKIIDNLDKKFSFLPKLAFKFVLISEKK